MGDDSTRLRISSSRLHFYPRPPYGGRPLRWQATACGWVSIHVPRMGDAKSVFQPSIKERVSIHVPRMGDVGRGVHAAVRVSRFLSTSPVWGTTEIPKIPQVKGEVSIHVPRMGDECVGSACETIVASFYPRPPYGGRCVGSACETIVAKFLSTSPVWGTGVLVLPVRQSLQVSIHVPRMGDGSQTQLPPPKKTSFYPRPPYGGRIFVGDSMVQDVQVSIHVPRMGDAKDNPLSITVIREVSIHVPRMGDAAQRMARHAG